MNWSFFIDRDLGKKLPNILEQSGITVERHGDLFPPDGSDEQWLEHCGTSGRVAISHNLRIRYVPNELAALKEFNVALFILIGQAPNAELARNQLLDKQQPPFIAKVYRPSAKELEKNPNAPGKVELWYPPPVTALAPAMARPGGFLTR